MYKNIRERKDDIYGNNSIHNITNSFSYTAWDFLIYLIYWSEFKNGMIKSILKDYMMKFKCEQRIKYGPDYELNYKIDNIDKDKSNSTATVYCIIYESFSKGEKPKERKDIIYFAREKMAGL